MRSCEQETGRKNPREQSRPRNARSGWEWKHQWVASVGSMAGRWRGGPSGGAKTGTGRANRFQGTRFLGPRGGPHGPATSRDVPSAEFMDSRFACAAWRVKSAEETLRVFRRRGRDCFRKTLVLTVDNRSSGPNSGNEGMMRNWSPTARHHGFLLRSMPRSGATSAGMKARNRLSEPQITECGGYFDEIPWFFWCLWRGGARVRKKRRADSFANRVLRYRSGHDTVQEIALDTVQEIKQTY